MTHKQPHPLRPNCHCNTCRPLERPCDCQDCRNHRFNLQEDTRIEKLIKDRSWTYIADEYERPTDPQAPAKKG